MVRRTKKETNKQMWKEADKSKQEQMKINKQTNKNTQLQNKIKLKKQTEFFLCPTLMTRQKKKSFFFLPSPKLTIFLILYTFKTILA